MSKTWEGTPSLPSQKLVLKTPDKTFLNNMYINKR